MNLISKLSFSSLYQTKNKNHHLNTNTRSQFITKVKTMATTCKPEELHFKTPTGHIAGQVWNKEAPVAVLCLHGWQDNSCTFDELAPLLPSHLCLVAVDLHSHGLSSHKPMGFSSTSVDYVITVDRIVKQCGWKQVLILGHSMGGAVGQLYAAIRPKVVHSLVLIDIIKPMHTDAHKLPERSEAALDAVISCEEKVLRGSRPSYSYEELLKRAMNSHFNSLSEAGVKTLLKRGSMKLPDGKYTFTYDLQVRSPNILSLTEEQVLAYAERLQCRMLIIKAEKGLTEPSKNYEKILPILERRCPDYLYVTVPGTHHLHLETPEAVIPLISEYLSPDKLKDVQNNINEEGVGGAIDRFIVANSEFHSSSL